MKKENTNTTNTTQSEILAKIDSVTKEFLSLVHNSVNQAYVNGHDAAIDRVIEYVKSPKDLRLVWSAKNKVQKTAPVAAPVHSKISGYTMRPQADRGKRGTLTKPRRMRKFFIFEELGIPLGAELQFRPDPTITVKVCDKRKVMYRRQITTLTCLSKILIPVYLPHRKTALACELWAYNGESLRKIMKRVYPNNKNDKK